MGKITKTEKDGKPKCVQFGDKKTVSIKLENGRLKLVEIDEKEAELGVVSEKDVSMLEPVLEILKNANTLEDAKSKLSEIKDAKFERWEDFMKMANSIYGDPAVREPVKLEAKVAQEMIKNVLGAYLDKENVNHSKVKEFMKALPCEHELRDPRERRWVFRQMYEMCHQLKGATQKEEELKVEIRAYIRDVRAQLAQHFYEPVDFLNDLEQAEELLAAAYTHAKLKKYDDAISTAGQATGCAPNFLDLYYALAEFSILKGDFSGAVEALEQIDTMPGAKQILPGRTDYYVLFSKLCKKLDKKDAPPHLAKLKEIAGKYSVPLDQIAA